MTWPLPVIAQYAATPPLRSQQPALLATTYRVRGGILFHPYASKATLVDVNGRVVCDHPSTDWCRYTYKATMRGEPDPHTFEPWLFSIEYPTKTHTKKRSKRKTTE